MTDTAAIRGGRKERVPFLVTIDAELDDGWSAPARPTTRNAAFLPRFQELCEGFGLRPTYFTNYEMTIDPTFIEFGRDLLRRDTGEIGMHLHAWNSPPTDHHLTERDHAYVPYLIEYPTPVMRDKIAYLTDLLSETFGQAPTSHRAGRWATDVRYFRLLHEFGYRVDCSVTPYETWAAHQGTPTGVRGSDYRRFPATPYRFDPERPHLPDAEGPLVQVPMTIVAPGRVLTRRVPNSVFRSSFVSRAHGRILPSEWLRPAVGNLASMVSIVERKLERGGSHLEFVIHSSELMPGGSPRFRTEGSIEQLYEDLGVLFERASEGAVGMTVSEFADEYDFRSGLVFS